MCEADCGLWDNALADLGDRDRAVLSALCGGQPTTALAAAAVARCRAWEAVETLDFLLFYGVPGLHLRAEEYTLDREVIGYLADFGIVPPNGGKAQP